MKSNQLSRGERTRNSTFKKERQDEKYEIKYQLSSGEKLATQFLKKVKRDKRYENQISCRGERIRNDPTF